MLGYMRFEEAFDIYLSYFPQGERRCTEDVQLKVELRHLLCHSEYGLCVYLLQLPGKDELVILRPDSFDLSHFLSYMVQAELDAQEAVKKRDKMLISKTFCQEMMSCVETEWDRRVLRVMISTGRTNEEYENLGFKSDTRNSDQKKIKTYLQFTAGLDVEAKAAVAHQLELKKQKLHEKIKKKKRLLLEKKFKWTECQIAEREEELETLTERHDSTEALHARAVGDEEVVSKSLIQMIRRKKSQLINAKRLLRRKQGGGRKRLIDEADEKFLEKCIAEKATAHGRRHDAVWYLNHRVKGSHLLELINQHHLKRNLPLVKSKSAVYNRSKPKNQRSIQAKNHIGLALFCCKKSPKSEDSSNILTHYCRSTKKVTSSSLCHAEPDLLLFRSFDDKAYLCPGTRTGMDSTRSQKVITTQDENLARKFKKYDFPNSMLSCTPGVFLYMTKSLQTDSNGQEVLVVDQQDVVVAVKSKYFVGSSGSVWGSHAIENRHRQAILHEVQNSMDTKTAPHVLRNEVRSIMDVCSSFLLQNVREDILQMPFGESDYRSYERKKVMSLLNALGRSLGELSQLAGTECMDCSQLCKHIMDGMDVGEDVMTVVEDTDADGSILLPSMDRLAECCKKLKEEIFSLELPMMRPRVVDLTDAGPGVGINNYEVFYRMAQESLICNYDYYARVHLAPGDSSMNEVERIQSSVGDAMADGGYIEWEHRKKFHDLSDEEVMSMSPTDLSAHEERRMKHNAFMVCEEIAARIDGNVAPNGYMKAYPSKKVENLFYWDSEYLGNFLKDIHCEVPGAGFYNMLKRYMDSHAKIGEKNLEIVKCQDTDQCQFCSSWVGAKMDRIPQPFPDYAHSSKFKYSHFSATPSTIDGEERVLDDYNPRVQLKNREAEGTISLTNADQLSSFSKKYIVDVNLVESELRHIHQLHLAQVGRSQATKKLRAQEKAKSYDDYDWKAYVDDGKLKKLTVATLDKYLVKHQLHQYMQLKKPQKIEIITSHYHAKRFENTVDDIDNENEEDAEGEDEVIALMSNEADDAESSEEDDSEDDADDDGDIEAPDDMDSHSEDHDAGWENPAWFTTTKSGRQSGNPMLSTYHAL